MEVVFGYLWSPMHVKLGVSLTDDFLMTSFSVVDESNGKQRKLFPYNAYKLNNFNIHICSFQIMLLTNVLLKVC